MMVEDAESETPGESEQEEVKKDVLKGPVYYLCPICSTEDKPHGFETLNKLTFHFGGAHTNRKTGGGGEKWADFKDQVVVTSIKPPNITKPKKKGKGKTKQSKKKGGKMAEDDDEEMEAELGEAAGLRGTIRHLIKTIAKLPEDDREELTSEREQLLDFMRTLSHKRSITAELVADIEMKVTDEIIPAVRAFTDTDEDKKGKKGDDKPPTTDKMMQGARVRSLIKADLQKIADLPTKFQDPLEGEKIVLMELNREISKGGVSKERLKEIEGTISSNRPFIDSAVKKSGKKKKDPYDFYDEDEDEGMDELDRSEYRDMVRKEKMLRYQVKSAEHRQTLLQLKKMNENAQNPGAAQQPQLTQRPKINPDTGQVLMSEDGQAIMEYVYVQPGMSGDTMGMTLLTAVLPSLINNARGGNSDGPSMKELELLQKANLLEVEKKILESKQASGGGESNAEIRELRAEVRTQQHQYYQAQVDRMDYDLKRAQAQAGRDQIQDLLDDKQRFIALGLVRDITAGEQDQNAAYANKVLNESKEALQETTRTIKEATGPLLEIGQNKLKQDLERDRQRMEREDTAQGQAPAAPRPPRRMTEAEKRQRWNEMYNQLDEEEDY